MDFSSKEEVDSFSGEKVGSSLIRRIRFSFVTKWLLESKVLPSLRRIGRGLSGFVYETTWEERDISTREGRSLYARKDFPLGSQRRNLLFESEVIPLFKLDHLNIVKCYGYTVGESSCSLLQEYVNYSLDEIIQRRIEVHEKNSPSTLGVESTSWIRNEGSSEVPGSRNTFQLGEVVDIISQIATGMKYLHENDVVHGDLKPKNVLICFERDDMETEEMEVDTTGADEIEADQMESGKMIVKVADFGLFQTKIRIGMGSKRTRQFEALMWKSPELLRDLLGFRADGWVDPFTYSDPDEDGSKYERGLSDDRNEKKKGRIRYSEYERELSDDRNKEKKGRNRYSEYERKYKKSNRYITTEESDVYSFGLTCSHILGAKLLFPELSLAQLQTQRLNGFRPELPFDCPHYIEALVYSCLESEDSKRPSFINICGALKGLESKEPRLRDFLKDLFLYESPIFYLEKLQSITSELEPNSEKCNYVVNKLTKAVQSAQLYFERFPVCRGLSSSKDWEMALKIFKFLFTLAKQVQSFVEGCCGLNARSLADIILPNVWEHYISSVCFDLELCTVVFLSSNNCGAIHVRTLTGAAAFLNAEGEIVEGKASLDMKETLLMNVKTLIQSSESDSEDHQLATLLLERLKSGPRAWNASYKDDLKEKSRLGSSTFCLVEKAVWLGVEVVVRIFLKLKHTDLEEEVAVFARLSHPNVVPLFCIAIDDRWGAIVVERMDGNLRNYHGHNMTDLEVVDFILQAAEGVLYLHDNHIVHGDLNPFNILVKCAGHYHVKVDINLYYRHNNRKTEIGESARWMAPECISSMYKESPSLSSKSSDVFSFGLVCYTILTGELPFSLTGNPEYLNRYILRGERPELPNHRPLKLRQLIEKCWDEDPTMRPSFGQICAELRHWKYLLLISETYLTTFDGLNAPNLLWHQCCGASCRGAGFLKREPGERDPHCENCAVAKVLRERARMTETTGDGLNSSQKLLFIEPTDVELQGEIYVDPSLSVSIVKWRTCIVARKQFFGNKEVDIALEVWHPNIVCYIGYSCTDSSSYPNYGYLFMELLDTDLGRFIDRAALEGRERPFSFQSTLDVLLQVAEPMNYLHEKNVVHGDLQPSNILMNCYPLMHSDVQFYLVKVADFSSSQRVDWSNATVEPFNFWSAATIYAAPEILKLRRHLGGKPPEHPKKIDVYSFGVVAYQVLTGVTHLYKGSTSLGIREGVIQGQLRPDSGFEFGTSDFDRSSLLPLIRRCWAPLPEDRPSFSQICSEIQALKSACQPN